MEFFNKIGINHRQFLDTLNDQVSSLSRVIIIQQDIQN